MSSTPIADPIPTPVAMKRDTRYHGVDIAKLFDDVVHREWLARRTDVPKHRLVDALMLLAVEHAHELPQYLVKLEERRAAAYLAALDDERAERGGEQP